MTLTKAIPVRNAGTAPLDGRLADMGKVVSNADGSPRTGVLGSAAQSIVSTTGTMNVTVAAAEFVTSKGKAEGVTIFTNNGAVNVPIPAAPVANSRIDVICVRHNDNTVGDATSVPEFVVRSGAANASPIKPGLTTGDVELATLRIYSGTTATNGGANVLTNTYQMTCMRGGVVPVRTKVELDLWTTAVDKQRAQVLATGIVYEWSASAAKWFRTTFSQTAKVAFGLLTSSVLGLVTAVALPADAPAGNYVVIFEVITDAGSVNNRFHRVDWAGVQLTDYTNDYASNAPIGAFMHSGHVPKLAHPGGAANVELFVQVNATGPIYRYGRLTVLYVGP